MALFITVLSTTAHAQTSDTTTATPDHSKHYKSLRKRAKVSKPADINGAGLLQFEYSYDGAFSSPDTKRDQAGTASLLFNASEDMQLELDFDTFHSQVSNSDFRATGIGDANLSAQFIVMEGTLSHPSLAFAYLIKIPTASAAKSLGTGRVDHKATILTSKKIADIDFDLNGSLLVNGDPMTHGWNTGYQLALGFTRNLTRPLCLHGEVFGETLDSDQPEGAFVQGGFAYRANHSTSIDIETRAGLDSKAPHFGLSAGISVTLGNLLGKKL